LLGAHSLTPFFFFLLLAAILQRTRMKRKSNNNKLESTPTRERQQGVHRLNEERTKKRDASERKNRRINRLALVHDRHYPYAPCESSEQTTLTQSL